MYDSAAAPDVVPDFDQIWYAAVTLLDGRDPYAVIGPGRAFEWSWPLYYPLMAPLSVLPLGLLPLPVARVLFAALPAAILAFVLTRDGPGRLAFFLSGSFMACVKAVQWPPLVACGLLVPWLGFLGAAKPNIGVAAMAGARSARDAGRMAMGASLLTAAAFAIQPGWFGEWREALAAAPHFRSYVLLPGGPLLRLALLRWRRWEARLLLALSLVPQTPSLQAPLLLLLVPRSLRALLVMGLLSFAPLFLSGTPGPTFLDSSSRVGLTTLIYVFLPTLWLVLREPNVGPAPPIVERIASRLPSWLRGIPGGPVGPGGAAYLKG